MSDLEVLELRDVAADLRSTIYFVRTLIGNGELRFLRVGKRFCVTREALDQWKRTAQGYIGEADLPRTKGKERGKPYIKAVKSA